MNSDESIAERYLNKHYSQVLYEPDGNIPPDFSIENSTGIEVRRLNQQHRQNGGSKGLEEGRIPLLKAIEKELSVYPRDTNGDNYWLLLRYQRSIGPIRDIKASLKDALTAFQSQSEAVPFCYNLSPNVQLEFVAKSEKLSRKYNIGIESDQDSGGWVVGLYVRDTMHCIQEKEQKIAPYIDRYESWWLLLIDHINCMDDYDREDILRQLSKPDCFQKVIVIKADGTKQFEI